MLACAIVTTAAPPTPARTAARAPMASDPTPASALMASAAPSARPKTHLVSLLLLVAMLILLKPLSMFGMNSSQMIGVFHTNAGILVNAMELEHVVKLVGVVADQIPLFVKPKP